MIIDNNVTNIFTDLHIVQTIRIKFNFKLSNGHLPQIRQNGELLLRMCRMRVTFWRMYRVSNVSSPGKRVGKCRSNISSPGKMVGECRANVSSPGKVGRPM
jgi:hypothetical protein